MRTQLRSPDEDVRAMADLAEVGDWSRLWGPPESGPAGIRALVARVVAATGWLPWAR